MTKNNSPGNYGYYLVLGVLTLISIILLVLFGYHNLFYQFYEINYAQINSSFISIFGIIFGFLFTAMAILFSLNENSLFMQLMKKHKRNKSDVIGYFALGIFTSLIVVIFGLILTITFIGDISLNPSENSLNNNYLNTSGVNTTVNISSISLNILSKEISTFPIYGMFYAGLFGLIQFVLLIITFIGLIVEKKSSK